MGIGNKIKTFRKMHKMSQQELATQIGVSRSTIACYENGHVSPSLDVICKLSEIFNVRVDAFMEQIFIDENDKNLESLEYNLEYLINKFEGELINKEVLFFDGKKLDDKDIVILIALIDNVKAIFAEILDKK